MKYHRDIIVNKSTGTKNKGFLWKRIRCLITYSVLYNIIDTNFINFIFVQMQKIFV